MMSKILFLQTEDIMPQIEVCEEITDAGLDVQRVIKLPTWKKKMGT